MHHHCSYALRHGCSNCLNDYLLKLQSYVGDQPSTKGL